MSDPRNIPRPAMFPMARPCRMTSQDFGQATPVHSHRAYPDKFGGGVTDVVAGHYHFISQGRILPSGRDGHKHTLSSIPCGAGR